MTWVFRGFGVASLVLLGVLSLLFLPLTVGMVASWWYASERADSTLETVGALWMGVGVGGVATLALWFPLVGWVFT